LAPLLYVGSAATRGLDRAVEEAMRAIRGKCQPRMNGIHPLLLLACTTLLVLGVAKHETALANEVPALEVEPHCRSEAVLHAERQIEFSKCMEQERAAKAELETSWSRFDLEDRAYCMDLTIELGSNHASYAQVLRCAIMLAKARAGDERQAADLGRR
jgi:hypothetical protein